MKHPTSVLNIIDSLNRRAFQNINQNIEKAVKLNEIARESSIAINYLRGMARSLLNSGYKAHEEYRIDIAYERLNQAHHMFLEISNDFWGLAASYILLGLVHIRKGQLEKAFGYLQLGLDLSREHNERELEAQALSYIGICQYKGENFRQGLEYFFHALEVDAENERATILHNIGCTYRELANYEAALEYQEKALRLAEEENRWSTQVVILEEMGLIYRNLGNEAKSEKTLKTALEQSARYYPRSYISINILLAEMYLKQRRPEEAESFLQKSLERINDSNMLENRKIYLISSLLYEHKGDYRRSLDYHKKYHALQTKVLSSKIDEKVLLMETEKLRKKNRQISSISKMGKSLISILDRRSLFKTVNECLSGLFSPEYSVIGEFDSGNQILSLKVFDLQSSFNTGMPFESDGSADLFKWIAINNTGLLMGNLETEYTSYLSEIDFSSFREAVRSLICLPFQVNGNPGIIGILSSDANAYSKEDRDLLSMLSSYLAIGLNNANQAELIREHNNELRKQNKFDPLTSIYNRREFRRRMEWYWQSERMEKSPISLLLIDIDFFKKVNDTWGHEAGDFCLVHMGNILKNLLQRNSDLYGRYGGEEFIVSMIGLSFDESIKMAEKIRSEIEKRPVIYEDRKLYMTVSTGLSFITPNDRTSAEEGIRSLINEADRNLYVSKKEGRNRLTASIYASKSQL